MIETDKLLETYRRAYDLLADWVFCQCEGRCFCRQPEPNERRFALKQRFLEQAKMEIINEAMKRDKNGDH